LGKKFEIDVVRDGSNIGMLRNERRYDFNHQSLEQPSFKVLKPNDELRYSCSYDTSSAKAPVQFGDLTQQEMCWGAIMYYPKQEVSNFQHKKAKASFFSARKTATRCGGREVEYNNEPKPPPVCQVKGVFPNTTGATTMQDSVQQPDVTAERKEDSTISSSSACKATLTLMIFVYIFNCVWM